VTPYDELSEQLAVTSERLRSVRRDLDRVIGDLRELRGELDSAFEAVAAMRGELNEAFGRIRQLAEHFPGSVS
jgi:hypothetical protein